MKPIPSLYEALYLIWNGIDFDKEKLHKFITRLHITKFLSFIPRYRKEYYILKQIHDSYDVEIINGLLHNDEYICRMAIIEKYARIGALDIAINGVYNRETYRIISNLPLEDYKLVLRRVQELVSETQKITFQSDVTETNIPTI